MTDRELLEFAAKAAGIELKGWTNISGNEEAVIGYDAYAVETWGPLTDDGDALRLAVKLHMTVRCYMGTTVAQIGTPGVLSVYEEVTDHGNPDAATRRAIVRAAAAIGKGMAQEQSGHALPEDNYYKSQAEAFYGDQHD